MLNRAKKITSKFSSDHSRIFHYLFFLFFFFLFLIKGLFYVDPDFGWHLRIGEIISQRGIPFHDPLSYSMPGYPFVDHEWLSDLLIYKIYKILNIFGLSVIFSLIAVSATFLVTPLKLNIWLVPFFFLLSVNLLPFFGVRPQIETWLFSAILIRVIYSTRLWQKYKFLLPILFLLWANLHGGFALGIVFLLIKLVSLIWDRRKIQLSDVFVASLCILVTLINPYGLRLWGEVWTSFTDPYLGQIIKEWSPIYLNFSLEQRFSFVLFLYISVILLILYRKEFSVLQFIVYSVLLIAAIRSKRHIPIWILSSWPLFVISIMKLSKFSSQIKRYMKQELNLKIMLIIFSVTVITISLIQARSIFIFAYNSSEDFRYPKYSLQFLNYMNIKGEVFSDYGWGGYLEWKMPSRKVFIDGRMPSWKWQSPDKRYSDSAMGDYKKIVSGDCNLKDAFERYNITTVIWPTRLFLSETSSLISSGSWEETESTSDPFLRCLISLGWKRVYSDPITLIYNKD